MPLKIKGDHITRDDLDALFSEYYNRLFNYIYYRTLNRALADDLVSQTMLNIVRNYESFDARKGNLDQWVYSIARNALFSHFRSMRDITDIEAVGESVVSYTDDYEFLDDRGTQVRRALEALDEEARELVYLKYWEELSNKEIGARLNMNPSTVSTKLWRATEKMRSVVAEL